jgi:predicted CDP-diglyceride synthetase/phosphatidate cytidylyltransferase
MSEFICRGLIAIILAGLIWSAVYWHYENLVYHGAQVAVFLDIGWNLLQWDKSRLMILGVWFMVAWSIDLSYKVYQQQPAQVLLLIGITQISDVLQYLAGRWLGRHYVGWLSPKKTYEGYAIGFLGLFGLSYLARPDWCVTESCQRDFLILGVLGFIGGLVNSLIKRFLDIKNWSGLLGPHGGFLDRIDSLVLGGFYLALNSHHPDVE